MGRRFGPMRLIQAALVLAVVACGPQAEVNPPTDPAPPVEAPAAVGSGAVTPGSAVRPGQGPASFVGRWAADVSWCATPSGDRRPIEITPLRFEGYENSCAIVEVAELADGYEARLQCLSEGEVRMERVRLAVSGQTLTLRYPERAGAPVILTKCTALDDVAPTSTAK